ILRDLDTARDAGVDVAAHVPWVFDAVEAVDERAEGQSRVADEVVDGVGDEVEGRVRRNEVDGAVVALLAWERVTEDEDAVERVEGPVLLEGERGRWVIEPGGVAVEVLDLERHDVALVAEFGIESMYKIEMDYVIYTDVDSKLSDEHSWQNLSRLINMDHVPTPSEPIVDEPARSFKRRKCYRKRVDTFSADEAGSAEGPSSSSLLRLDTSNDPLTPSFSHSDGEEQTSGDISLPISEILRRRRAAQRRRAGIEFSNATSVPDGGAAVGARLGDEVLDNEDSFGKILTVVDRFAPQTGQVVDVDKHMMAYIDSELAKRHQGQERPALASDIQELDDDAVDSLPADLARHRQPAALGKLHEIDLGVDATLRNIARTEAAKKRLDGGEPEVEEATGKVRLRRDGKPWRGRRRRRNSDDVKRDKLVEEVMKESRLEIYDELEAEMPNDDQAADDRIAEKFRREFMDAVSSRRHKVAQSTKKGSGAKVDDKPRGPKLGGSRSARAAMRELQEKAAKK
ncbi:MAG: hypothetical protein Q9211_006940, partial [Gyalolechia sp. 1 TL-2023]